MHGKRVGLLVQRQRYRCHQCRRTCVDPTPGPDDQRRVTERLKIFVAQQMLARPFTAVATEVDCVRAVFCEAVGTWDRTRTLVTPKILGIDEVVLGQPRCVLTNVEEQTLRDVLPHRTCEQIHLTHLPQPNGDPWTCGVLTRMQCIGHCPTPRLSWTNSTRCGWPIDDSYA